MNASELYEQLVTGITDSILGEEVRTTAPGGIKVLRLSAEEASARRTRPPVEVSATMTAHLNDLKSALETGKIKRRDGSVVNMHPEIRKRIQAEHDRIVSASEPSRSTGAEAFNALFK